MKTLAFGVLWTCSLVRRVAVWGTKGGGLSSCATPLKTPAQLRTCSPQDLCFIGLGIRTNSRAIAHMLHNQWFGTERSAL